MSRWYQASIPGATGPVVRQILLAEAAQGDRVATHTNDSRSPPEGNSAKRGA